MSKKATASKETAKASQPSIESDIDKALVLVEMRNPKQKMRNKSPSRDEKPKQTKSKTKTSSTRKGKSKSKNIESYVEGSHVSGNTTTVGSSKTTLCGSTRGTGVTENTTQISGNTTMTTQRQEQDFEQKGENLKTASSIPGETDNLQSSPGPARVGDTPVPPAPEEDSDVPSTPGQRAKGEGSGRRTMVQTNLSMTKDGIEVLSSPEQQQTEKKKGKKTSSKKKEKSEKTQTRITNIFPLRKSNRKNKSQQEKDEQARISKAIISKTFEGLEVRTMEDKGRGVFASHDFQRNEFMCEYSGELISPNEAKKRENQYGEDRNIGCYMYYLQCNNNKYCIDATAEDGTLGRLLNHSRSGNCKTKVHVIKDKPHLIFVATRDVKTGEELTYDYGDRSKDSLQSHPWLKY